MCRVLQMTVVAIKDIGKSSINVNMALLKDIKRVSDLVTSTDLQEYNHTEYC
jgi:hypothetical protein